MSQDPQRVAERERLALGWNQMNDYERGYVAAGPVAAQHTYTPACDGCHAAGPCPPRNTGFCEKKRV